MRANGATLHAERDPAELLRGRLFTDLDRLAFALELEAAEALETGDEAAAVRIEDRRLGVRLAQRLVAGVHADEVDLRIERARQEYAARTEWPEQQADPPAPSAEDLGGAAEVVA